MGAHITVDNREHTDPSTVVKIITFNIFDGPGAIPIDKAIALRNDAINIDADPHETRNDNLFGEEDSYPPVRINGSSIATLSIKWNGMSHPPVYLIDGKHLLVVASHHDKVPFKKLKLFKPNLNSGGPGTTVEITFVDRPGTIAHTDGGDGNTTSVKINNDIHGYIRGVGTHDALTVHHDSPGEGEKLGESCAIAKTLTSKDTSEDEVTSSEKADNPTK